MNHFPCFMCVQGDVITVIKRVDENWGEGKLGDKVGIFPLQFTEVRQFHLSVRDVSESSEGKTSSCVERVDVFHNQ